jgi:hypothetical protein
MNIVIITITVASINTHAPSTKYPLYPNDTRFIYLLDNEVYSTHTSIHILATFEILVIPVLVLAEVLK